METMKKELVTRLADKEAVFYSLLSACTREPYVECDEETFDDKVMLFFEEQEAKEMASALAEKKVPVTVMKIASPQMLVFFTSLFTMGVNGVQVNMGKESVIVQIDEIVKRREPETMPDGTVWVENSQLHLTAIYFAQELRKPAQPDTKERLKELQEEMGAHFQKSSFLFALEKEGQGTPVITLKDGKKYQPVFTDAVEFSRFNREGKFKAVIVEADKLGKVLDKEAQGVILNMTGVNLPLMVARIPAKKA